MRRAMRRSTVERLYLEKSCPVRTRRCAMIRRSSSSSKLRTLGATLSLIWIRSTSRLARSSTGSTKSATPVDGASRHGGIFGLVGFLYEDDAAGFLDGAHADGAVRSGAA